VVKLEKIIFKSFLLGVSNKNLLIEKIMFNLSRGFEMTCAVCITRNLLKISQKLHSHYTNLLNSKTTENSQNT
jgi:hypothetical protein